MFLSDFYLGGKARIICLGIMRILVQNGSNRSKENIMLCPVLMFKTHAIDIKSLLHCSHC